MKTKGEEIKMGKEISNPKIIITGDGFIPEEITKALKDEFEVFRINSTTEQDVCNFNLKMKGVDMVIHCSELRDAPDPHILQWNVMGTANILNWCDENKVSNFVYISTGDIYGNKTVFPSNETFKPDPLGMYATTKYMGELLVELWHKTKGIKTLMLRPFEVYGDNEIQSIVGKMKITPNEGTIEGSPDITKDFMHVKDLVRVVKMYAERKTFNNLTLNVGTKKETSFEEVAKMLGKEFSYKPNKSIPRRSMADIEHLDFTGLKPKVELEKWIGTTQTEKDTSTK